MTPDQICHNCNVLHLIQFTKLDNTTERIVQTEDKFSYHVRNGSRDSMTSINQKNKVSNSVIGTS